MPEALVALADWQATYAGLNLGVGSPYTIVPPLEGLADMPDLRTGDQPRLRRHGLLPGDDFLAGRSTTMRFRVISADPVEFGSAWDAFGAAMRPGQDEQPLVFQIPGVAGGGTRRLVCRPRRLALPVDLAHALNVATATVQFDASDPRIYDDLEQTLTTDLAASVAGLTWPLAWNLNWGGASTSGTINAVNAGTFPAPWTARIDGPVTNPIIENLATGQRLAFTADGGLTLGVDEFLLVDSETRSALLNGTASRYSTLAAPVSWWDLPPGSTAMRFGGTTTGSPTLTVTFRSAWI